MFRPPFNTHIWDTINGYIHHFPYEKRRPYQHDTGGASVLYLHKQPHRTDIRKGGSGLVYALLFFMKKSFMHTNDETNDSNGAENDVRNQQLVSKKRSINSCRPIVIEAVHRQVQTKD